MTSETKTVGPWLQFQN